MLKEAHFTLEAPTATVWFGEDGLSETETPAEPDTEFMVTAVVVTAAKFPPVYFGVTGWPSWLSTNIASDERWTDN